MKKILLFLIIGFLVPTAALAADETITFATTNNFNQPIADAVGFDEAIAQQFIPSINVNYASFVVWLSYQGSDSGKHFKGKLVMDNADTPDLNAPIADDIMDAPGLPPYPFGGVSPITFTFGPNLSLTAGIKYWFVFQIDDPIDLSNFPVISMDYSGSPYTYFYSLQNSGAWSSAKSFNLQGFLDLYAYPNSSTITAQIVINSSHIYFGAILLLIAICLSLLLL